MTSFRVFQNRRPMSGTSHGRVQPISRHDEWCNAELRRRRAARQPQYEGRQS